MTPKLRNGIPRNQSMMIEKTSADCVKVSQAWGRKSKQRR